MTATSGRRDIFVGGEVLVRPLAFVECLDGLFAAVMILALV
jgi:hypothetical protein